MRQITLDIETTGLSSKSGDRLIEIGCVEIIDRVITGKVFHSYCNPERAIGEVATKITGINDKFLLDKPKFINIFPDFCYFIQGADELIIHNSAFDLEFISNELNLIKYPTSEFLKQFKVIDTLVLARTMHPGQRNNLDALAKRYNISFTREFHGALLDAKILANLFLKMTAGQISLDFSVCLDNKEIYLNYNNLSNLNNMNLHHHSNSIIKNNVEMNNTMLDIISNINLKVIYATSDELAMHDRYWS